MNLSRDVRSLSDFKRNTVGFMKQMAQTGEPMVLTVNGKAKLIVQDAESYQELLQSLDYSQGVKGIRQGIQDVELGKTKPVSRVFSEIRRSHKQHKGTRKISK
jgi:prevent-host-death family protein